MTTYVLRRLLLMLPVAFLVTVGVFLLIHLTPGDPALILLGEDRSPQAIEQIHQQLGLDKPLYVQYVIWIGRIAHGDLGRSITTHQPVGTAIAERLPATVELGLAALFWSLIVAIPLGTIAAVRRGSIADQIATGISVGGVSIPNFFIGIVLIFVLSVTWRLFPFGGYVAFAKDPFENLRHIVLRSEEHTSELQSRGHLVCRLLLEKKNERHRGHGGGALRREGDDAGRLLRAVRPGSKDPWARAPAARARTHDPGTWS